MTPFSVHGRIFPMGLYQTNFRFDGPLPDLDAACEEVRRRLGRQNGLEGFELNGDVVIARSALDPFTHPVVCAVIVEMGGQELHLTDGNPVITESPIWALSPLSDLSWKERMAIRLRWWVSIFLPATNG